MDRTIGIALMKKALEIVDKQWPDMADAYMKIPTDYYTDKRSHTEERKLFETQPLALLASSEIPNANDYYTRQAVGRSVVICRDEDGVARAFLNYCRHRGAEPAAGCGNSKYFTCPYHAWSYDTKGQLVTMPLRNRYADLELSELSLVELPCEERHGLVWVVMTAGAAIDVAAHLGELDHEIGSLGIEKMRYYSSLPEAHMNTNWKAVSEGVVEGLHVPYVHASTFNLNPQAFSVDLSFYEAIGPHLRYGLPIFDQEGAKKIKDTPESEWNPAQSIGCIWWISPGLLIAQELYGLIYADFSQGTSVNESVFRYGWMSPVATPPEGQPSPEDMAARATRAIAEDIPVWEGCTRGLNFGQHGYALIGRNEKGVQLMHESIARQTGYDGLSYQSDR